MIGAYERNGSVERGGGVAAYVRLRTITYRRVPTHRYYQAERPSRKLGTLSLGNRIKLTSPLYVS